MEKSFREKLTKVVTYSALALSFAQPIFGVTTAIAAPQSIEELQLEEENIQTRISNHEASLEEVIQRISEIEDEVLVLLGQIKGAETDIEELAEEIEAMNGEITKLEREIKKAAEELKEKMELYDANLEVAANRAVTLQIKNGGRMSMYLDILLNEDGFSDTLGQLRAVEVLLDAHDSQMHQINDQAIMIEESKSILDKNQKSLIDDRADLEDKERNLKEKRAKLHIERNSIEETIEALDKEREEIEKEHNKTFDELNDVRANIEGQKILEEQQRAQAARIASSNVGSIASIGISGTRDSGITSRILADAESFMGVPYLWGGTTPGGFDCSGFVQYVYARAGINLPRVTTQQVQQGDAVSMGDVQPGDLYFWDKGGKVYHVAIAIGNGKYIHAPRPGKSVSVGTVSGFTPSSARRVIPNEKKVAVVSSTTNSAKGELLGDFRATAYAVGGWAVPGTVTANGTDISNTIYSNGHRVIATDPKVIPTNSVVYVEAPGMEPFTAIAADTGGAIKGNIIDILFDNVPDAMKFGRQSGIKIYQLK